MTASKATLCAGVTRGKRRVWPRSTWCSSCITRTKRCASVRQCSSTKRGLTRRTGRRSQLTQAVGTSSVASTLKSCRSAPRAWLAGGDGVEDAAHESVGVGSGGHRGFLREEQDEGVRVDERAARCGETAGRAARNGARARPARRRAEGAGRSRRRCPRRGRRPTRSGTPASRSALSRCCSRASGRRRAPAARAGAAPAAARTSHAARQPRRPSRSRSDTRDRPTCQDEADAQPQARVECPRHRDARGRRHRHVVEKHLSFRGTLPLSFRGAPCPGRDLPRDSGWTESREAADRRIPRRPTAEPQLLGMTAPEP